MRLVRIHLVPGLALLAILPTAPLPAQHEGPSLAPQFEPSYVGFGPWSRHHPDTTLFFEASILTPKVILRQFAEGSWPVKTPSYIYYDQRLSVFRLGFATNRDRARSEIPQQPVF